MSSRLDPRDPSIVDQIVHEVKSQGVFDEFRKSSIADVDTKPAYQNLRQRVENTVKKFLSEQEWTPETNKIQLREKLRKHIQEANFLDVGVERIVDQVVNPKIATVFRPRIEEIAYKLLGLPPPEKPETFQPLLHTMPGLPINGVGSLHVKTENLLPTDLEQVSPESDLKEEPMDLENSDEESPPFEPLQDKVKVKADVKTLDETDPEAGSTPVYQGDDSLSNNSESSIIQKDDTSSAFNVDPIKDASQSFDANNSQESQLSRNSNGSNGTPAKATCSKETTVNISEEAQMPKFSDNFPKTEPNDENTDFHFDINKDEIKFEGTERKPCMENDSKENEDIKNNSNASKDCEMTPLKVETPNDFEFTKTASIITKPVDEGTKIKVDEEEQNISSSIDDSRSTQNLLIDETPLADPTTTDDTTTFNTPSLDSTTTPQEENNILKVSSSSSSRHKHSKSRYRSHDKDSKGSRNREKDYERSKDRERSRDSKRDKDKEHDKNRKDRDKKDEKEKDKDKEKERERERIRRDRDRVHTKTSDSRTNGSSSRKESSSSSHRYKSSSQKTSKSDKDSRSVSHSKNNTPTSSSSSSKIDDTKRQKDDKDRDKSRHHDRSRRHGDDKSSSRKYTSSSSKNHSTHKSRTNNDDHYEKKFKLNRRSSNDSNDENKGDEKKLVEASNIGNKTSNDQPSDPQISNGKEDNSTENVKSENNTAVQDETHGKSFNADEEMEICEPEPETEEALGAILMVSEGDGNDAQQANVVAEKMEMDLNINQSHDELQAIPEQINPTPATEQELTTEAELKDIYETLKGEIDLDNFGKDDSEKTQTDINDFYSFDKNHNKNKEDLKNVEISDELKIQVSISEPQIEHKQDQQVENDVEMEVLSLESIQDKDKDNNVQMNDDMDMDLLTETIESKQEDEKVHKAEEANEDSKKTDSKQIDLSSNPQKDCKQIDLSSNPQKDCKQIDLPSNPQKDFQKTNEEIKDASEYHDDKKDLSIKKNEPKKNHDNNEDLQDQNIDPVEKNDQRKNSLVYMSDEDFLGFESDSSERRNMGDFLKHFEQIQVSFRHDFSSHHDVSSKDVYHENKEGMAASKAALTNKHDYPKKKDTDNDHDMEAATKKQAKKQKEKKTNTKFKNLKRPIEELHIECEERNAKGKESSVSAAKKRGESGQSKCKNKPSPTPSDSSCNSKENERFDKNTGEPVDNKRRTRSSRKLTEQQRYNSEDLYKPKLVLRQGSKRRNLLK